MLCERAGNRCNRGWHALAQAEPGEQQNKADNGAWYEGTANRDTSSPIPWKIKISTNPAIIELASEQRWRPNEIALSRPSA
jgi:hypothetical protein